MSFNGFDPKGYAEYICTMASADALKVEGEARKVVDALEEQRKLEWAVLVCIQKIGVLDRELVEQRKMLSDYAVKAAVHREVVTKLLHGLDIESNVMDKENISGPKNASEDKTKKDS